MNPLKKTQDGFRQDPITLEHDKDSYSLHPHGKVGELIQRALNLLGLMLWIL